HFPMPFPLPVNSSCCSFFACLISTALGSGSEKCAQPGDGLANDQVLHLIGTFVRIERLRIGEVTGCVVVSDNAVTAQEFTTPGNGLAHARGAKRFRQRSVLVR